MKNVKHSIIVAFLSSILLVVAVQSSLACSCAVSPPIDIAFEQPGNIAVLKLQSVEKLGEGEKGDGVGGIKQSVLTVEKVFKGNLQIGQKLTFPQSHWSDCVWTFDEKSIGVQYLFYLNAKPDKDNYWVAFMCSRSGTIEYRGADLKYLENMSKVRGKTRLSGMLTKYISVATEDEESTSNQLSGYKIKVSGMGKNFELTTDANGVYEIYDLPVGKYKITPEKVEGYKFSDDEENDSVEVEIKAKSQTERNFRFYIHNAIRGRVYDTSGKTLENVGLDLLPARGEKPPYFYQSSYTDKAGKFKFTEIPAGTYVIVINEEGEITSDEPFGTFYYPSAVKREDATEITIGAGDFREDLIINAPQTAETVTISGVLLFENGKPAVGESVKFFTETEGKKAVSNEGYPDARAEAGKDGKFNIKILKGQKGKLFGSMFTYVGKYENCPKLDKIIKAKGESAPEVETSPVAVEATSDLGGVELKFPFPSCKKARIE